MKSRISFIDSGILRNDIKSMGWMGIVYLLGLLGCIPLQIFMLHSRPAAVIMDYNTSSWLNNNPYLRLFEFNSGLQILFLLVIPVLTGLLLFRYLHCSQSSDMIHSLPVKRTTLYNTHIVAGIIFLFVPILVTALISGLALKGLGITYVPAEFFYHWLWLCLISNLLLFMTAVLMAVLTGMSSVQGALTYIVLVLPTAFLTILYHNLHTYIYGFAYDYYSSNLINLSPLLRLSDFPQRAFTGRDMAVYVAGSLILYFLGRYLYQRRHLEVAGNALAFAALIPVFKYSAAFCGMLLLGSYFNSVQDSMAWTYFGYVLGSLLGYWLSEILIHKSVHVFKLKAARGYVIFGLAMVLVIGAVNCDFTGYEQKMPPLAQVESVYWDNSFYQLTKTIPANSSISVYAENPDDAYQREVSMIYTQPDSVANIYALHKAIIANGQRDESLAQPSKNDSRQNFSFAYTLKNGDTLYRQYSIPVEQYRSQLKPVYESQERKLKVNDVLHITPAQVDLVTVSANEVNRSIKITDPAKIKEAILAIQNDVRAQTYEEITSNRVPWAQISLLLSNEKYIRLDWSKSYAEFSGWLAGNGYNARVQAADIKYVLVEKAPAEASNPEMEKYRGQFPAEYLADLEQRGNYIKITDPQQIEVCLNNYSYKDRGQTYNVIFLLKDGNSFSGSFNEESKPDFIE